MKKLILILFAVSTLAACQHTLILPGSLRQRPDVSGEQWGGQVSFGVRRAAPITIFDDIRSNPPVRSDTADENISTLVPLPFVDVGLAVLPRFEAYFNTGFGLKWLFMGEPRAEGWKAAVFAGAPNGPWNVSGPTDSDCTASCQRADTSFSGAEYGLTFGKQTNASTLVYLTLGQQKGNAHTEIEQTANTFTYKDKFEHNVGTIGITLGEKWYFLGEVGGYQTKWTKEEGGDYNVSGYSFAIGGGYYW